MEYQLFSEKAEIKFYAILRELAKINCTYLTYTLEKNENQRVSFFSDKNWFDIFTHQNFDMSCQITQCTRLIHKGVIHWAGIQPIDDYSKIVIESRGQHNIHYGITFVNQFRGLKEIISFASTIEHNDFVLDLVKMPQLLMNIFKKLKSVASTEFEVMLAA